MPEGGRARFVRGVIRYAAMLAWAWAAPIQAGESDFGVGVSLTHNSNIARVETNPQSEWTEAVMAGLFYREDTVDVTARVLAQVERRHFVRGVFSDDTGGFLDGAAVWTILSRRLTWTVEDVFRQVILDQTAQDTPSNRAKANSLSTGPDVTFPFSSTNSAVIGGRYGRFDIENSNSDNQRYTAFVRGVHAMSSQTKVSLNYEWARAYFEPSAQPFPKVLREDWFARYDNHSVTNSTVIDLGTTRVTRYGGPDQESGRLARLTLAEAFSSQSAIRLALSDQISDTYSDQISGVTSSTAPRDTGVVALNAGNFATGDLYHSRRGDLAYGNNDGRFGYTLQAYGRHVDFFTLDEDYQEKGVTFLWTWLVSSALRFNVSATYAKRTYESFDREDQDRNAAAGVNFKLNRNVTMTVEGGRTERQSTAAGLSFVDNRVMFLVGYSTGPLYEVRSRR